MKCPRCGLEDRRYKFYPLARISSLYFPLQTLIRYIRSWLTFWVPRVQCPNCKHIIR